MTAASQPMEAAIDEDVPAEAERARLGRKRDHTRDPEILDAAVEILSEVGYDGMTVDMVAARAKAGKATLYRRWPSKNDLVIDAVACMKATDIDLSNLPDTGTLRGDLVAMIRPPSIADAERKLKVMAGVVSMLSRNPELADAAREAIFEPRASATRALLRRAIERGEIPADADVETLALVTPSMVSFRVLVLHRPVDRGFLESIIDKIILPTLGIAAPPQSKFQNGGDRTPGASA